MREFLNSIDWVALVGALVSLVGGITALVVVLVNAKNTKKITTALDEAKQKSVYFVCPNCHKKIPLSEVDFHLPSGAVDNNLNGKPDYLE